MRIDKCNEVTGKEAPPGIKHFGQLEPTQNIRSNFPPGNPNDLIPANLRRIEPSQTTNPIKRIGSFRDINAFREYLSELGIDLPTDDQILRAQDGSPLARDYYIGPFRVGNRWCIHPMEGWDGTPDGKPTESVIRRWTRFGTSGAKLIWGGEAFAVQHDGRANPNQLSYSNENIEPMLHLLATLVSAHRIRFGSSSDLLVGLQLTHSGRFCKPNDKKKFEPKILYHHPVLDSKFGIDPNDDSVVITDDWIKKLIDNFIIAARMAQEIGFHFVDIKACHGYLGHEFLSAYDRKGLYGGDFEGRTRFVREVIEGIKSECPDLMVGVRLSAFDTVPYIKDPNKISSGVFGRGIPVTFDKSKPYPAFGVKRDDPHEIDLTEPVQLLRMLKDELGVELLNISAGSPYYDPHIQRPAVFPPSDAYKPPEDPLIGCARQIYVTKALKQFFPSLPIVGTAYTYFQEFLPHVAQGVIRKGWTDFIGIGRMVLSYNDLPSDSLEKGTLDRTKICRTFSDCTTAPRSGLPSGCFPLDDYYKDSPDAAKLKAAKDTLRDQQRLRALSKS